MAIDLLLAGKRHDADVFTLWEQGTSAEAIYTAVAADGEFSLAELLAAADVVLEIKDLIAKEQSGKHDARHMAKLQSQLTSFHALYRRILRASKDRDQLARI
ncbi:MAG: hypothetical protein AAB426_08875 [Myxococcota bacterium]